MLSYCFRYRKNTESKNPKVVRTKNGTVILLSKCEVCNSQKSKFLNEPEAKGLLSNFSEDRIPILIDIPLVNTLF